MKRYFRWASKAVAIYLLFLVIYFCLSVASNNYPLLAFYERKISPSAFVFWQGGEFYSNPPLFSTLMTDTKSQLSSDEVTTLDEVDIFVLLLNGFNDIENVEFAPQLGINIKEIASTEPTRSVTKQTTSFHIRLHLLPFVVKRRQTLIMDAHFLSQNYKKECLDELVYGQMISV